MDDPTRRRSPGYLRTMSSLSLHRLTFRLHHRFMHGLNSTREDWLLDMCINELEYRQRRASRNASRMCTCQFCWGPFDRYVEGEEWPP